jgi:AGCS family alanine or glycine:cation symporter
MVIIAVYYGFPGATLWIFSDASTALPIFANIIALFILFPKFKELLQDYKSRYLGVGKVKPDFKVFYENENAEDIES